MIHQPFHKRFAPPIARPVGEFNAAYNATARVARLLELRRGYEQGVGMKG